MREGALKVLAVSCGGFVWRVRAICLPSPAPRSVLQHQLTSSWADVHLVTRAGKFAFPKIIPQSSEIWGRWRSRDLCPSKLGQGSLRQSLCDSLSASNYLRLTTPTPLCLGQRVCDRNGLEFCNVQTRGGMFGQPKRSKSQGIHDITQSNPPNPSELGCKPGQSLLIINDWMEGCKGANRSCRVCSCDFFRDSTA